MKILWFTNTSSLYNKDSNFYGGGWIDSLESLINESKELNLAVSFFHKTDNKKFINKNTTYYPILRQSAKKTPIKSLLKNYTGKGDDENFIKDMLKVINDFKPNIIHVFGTEEVFSTIQNHTDIPVVIQIQGLMNPCFNNYFPPGVSQKDFLLSFKYFRKNLIGASPYFTYKKFIDKAKRESEILSKSKYLIGRTSWDKKVSLLLAPNAKYFHIDEVLRPSFYKSNQASKLTNKKIIILSTLSEITYKGLDVILKTANLLKTTSNVNFIWKVIGVKDDGLLLNFFEKKYKISFKESSVIFLANKNSSEITKLMSSADLYIHTSYIDNSPNSVCEAQILTLPIIACNVGGVSSIIKDNLTGILVPSNGIYEIAQSIIDYYTSPKKFFNLAINGKKVADKRHNKMIIKEQLINTYNYILNNAKFHR